MTPLWLALPIALIATLAQADQQRSALHADGVGGIVSAPAGRAPTVAPDPPGVAPRRSAMRPAAGLPLRAAVDPIISLAMAALLRLEGGQTAALMTQPFRMGTLPHHRPKTPEPAWPGGRMTPPETDEPGSTGMSLGAITIDMAAQTYRGQVLVLVADLGGGPMIGAVTLGLAAEVLF